MVLPKRKSIKISDKLVRFEFTASQENVVDQPLLIISWEEFENIVHGLSDASFNNSHHAWLEKNFGSSYGFYAEVELEKN